MIETERDLTGQPRSPSQVVPVSNSRSESPRPGVCGPQRFHEESHDGDGRFSGLRLVCRSYNSTHDQVVQARVFYWMTLRISGAGNLMRNMDGPTALPIISMVAFAVGTHRDCIPGGKFWMRRRCDPKTQVPVDRPPILPTWDTQIVPLLFYFLFLFFSH
jgi:hypothetical protein